MRIESAAVTHQGNIRENNEDNFFLDGLYKEDTSVGEAEFRCSREADKFDFAVSDGVGGASYGEVASHIAVTTLGRYHELGLGGAFVEYIDEANDLVCQEMSERRANRMGATVAMLHIEGDTAACCNVGDSRIYVYSQGVFSQLSLDHRSAQGPGMPTLLTQHLGVFPDEFILGPHIERDLPLDPGTMYLLCTDGLTDMVPDDQLQVAVDACKGKTPEDIASILMELALTNGGRDNVTVMIVRICDGTGPARNDSLAEKRI